MRQRGRRLHCLLPVRKSAGGAKRRCVCLLSAHSYHPVITFRVCEALAFQNRAALENEGAWPALITILPPCVHFFRSLSVNIDGPHKVRRAAGGKKKLTNIFFCFVRYLNTAQVEKTSTVIAAVCFGRTPPVPSSAVCQETALINLRREGSAPLDNPFSPFSSPFPESARAAFT